MIISTIVLVIFGAFEGGGGEAPAAYESSPPKR